MKGAQGVWLFFALQMGANGYEDFMVQWSSNGWLRYIF
jgi:hypothetical protein